MESEPRRPPLFLYLVVLVLLLNTTYIHLEKKSIIPCVESPPEVNMIAALVGIAIETVM